MSLSDRKYFYGTMSSHSSNLLKSSGNAPMNPAWTIGSTSPLEHAEKYQSLLDSLVRKQMDRPEHGDRDLTSRAIISVQKSRIICPSSDWNVPNSSFGRHFLSTNGERNVTHSRHQDNPEYLEMNEARLDHSNESERSKELLQRAKCLFGRASLALSSSSQKMDNPSGPDPRCPPRVLFSGSQDNLSNNMSPLNQSSSETRKLDPPAWQPKSSSKDPPGSVSGSSATSTTGTIWSSEAEVQQSGMSFQSPCSNPYAHYPDPDIQLSIMSTEDSLETSSPMVGAKQEGPRFRNLHSRHDRISSHKSPRLTRSYSLPYLGKRNCSLDKVGRVAFQDIDIDRLVTSRQKCNPVVGDRQYYSSDWTTSPRKANRSTKRPMRHFYQDKGGMTQNEACEDSLTCTAEFPSPFGGSNEHDRRGHDSISTLSVGSAVNKARLGQEMARIAFQNPIQIEGETTIRHCGRHPTAVEEGPLTFRTPSPRSNYPTTSTFPASYSISHSRLGGPGGKYVVDEPLPIPTCCELFFGSCHSSIPGGIDENAVRSPEEMRFAASFVRTMQKHTPTTPMSPESVMDFPRLGPLAGRFVVQERISC